jgi:hypothetical protein
VREVVQFPNPVNEVAARTVAGGVVLLCVTYLVTGWTWVLVVLAYGFIARVLAGPRLSPLALLVTRVLVPALGAPVKEVPGPPKRFAQGMGVVFSSTALVLALLGATGGAQAAIVLLAAAAFLESVFAFCLGCKVFALLMRAGVIPESVCVECSDLSRRLPAR